MALSPRALLLALSCWRSLAFAVQDAPTRPGGQLRKNQATVRLSAGNLTASYSERNHNERESRVGSRDAVKLSGSEAQAAFSISEFETELGTRTLSPSGLPSWTRRSELTLIERWYWQKLPWIQPAFGAFQVEQTGDQTDPDAQPAFISRNTGLIFGLHASYNLLAFSWHGVFASARIDYLSSLEKRYNFGTESAGILGYYLAFGKLRFALYGRLARSFFNASEADSQDKMYRLKVRHTYEAQSLGIQLDY